TSRAQRRHSSGSTRPASPRSAPGNTDTSTSPPATSRCPVARTRPRSRRARASSALRGSPCGAPGSRWSRGSATRSDRRASPGRDRLRRPAPRRVRATNASCLSSCALRGEAWCDELPFGSGDPLPGRDARSAEQLEEPFPVEPAAQDPPRAAGPALVPAEDPDLVDAAGESSGAAGCELDRAGVEEGLAEVARDARERAQPANLVLAPREPPPPHAPRHPATGRPPPPPSPTPRSHTPTRSGYGSSNVSVRANPSGVTNRTSHAVRSAVGEGCLGVPAPHAPRVS